MSFHPVGVRVHIEIFWKHFPYSPTIHFTVLGTYLEFESGPSNHYLMINKAGVESHKTQVALLEVVLPSNQRTDVAAAAYSVGRLRYSQPLTLFSWVADFYI